MPFLSLLARWGEKALADPTKRIREPTAAQLPRPIYSCRYPVVTIEMIFRDFRKFRDGDSMATNNPTEFLPSLCQA